MIQAALGRIRIAGCVFCMQAKLARCATRGCSQSGCFVRAYVVALARQNQAQQVGGTSTFVDGTTQRTETAGPMGTRDPRAKGRP